MQNYAHHRPFSPSPDTKSTSSCARRRPPPPHAAYTPSRLHTSDPSDPRLARRTPTPRHVRPHTRYPHGERTAVHVWRAGVRGGTQHDRPCARVRRAQRRGVGVRPVQGGRSRARGGECPRPRLGFCACPLAKRTRRTAVSQAADAVSLARPAAVSILDVFAGFRGVFGKAHAVLRRWCGAVADVSSVHKVRLQLDRTRTALTGSDFQVARTAHLRQHTKYGACAFAKSISWTLD